MGKICENFFATTSLDGEEKEEEEERIRTREAEMEKKYELKWSGKRCRLWSFYFEEKDFENQRGVPRLFD